MILIGLVISVVSFIGFILSLRMYRLSKRADRHRSDPRRLDSNPD